MDHSKWSAWAWLCLALVGCSSERAEVQSRREALEGEGFASPIPLPSLADIDERVCLEEVIRTGRERSLVFNGNAVVDLGIFHIHEEVEHTNSADSCGYCPGGRREGHIVLGQEPCRRRVLRMGWPNTEQGRKDRADALLGECGEVVLSFGVCLDRASRKTTLESRATWDQARDELMCINLGGPTGSHSPHPALVQWMHLREHCPRLAANPALHTSSYEAGKLHVGMAADIVHAALQDTPRCGAMAYRKCRECGSRHARCCNAYESGYDATRVCDPGLACEGAPGFERCLPHPPEAPNDD